MLPHYPHQLVGLAKLKEVYRAGKMGGWGHFWALGGGKSRTIVEFLDDEKPGKTLICVPAFMRRPWLKEFKTWRPDSTLRVSSVASGKDVAALEEHDVLLCSYELLKHLTGPYDVLVIDEGHYIAKENAQRSKDVKRIANSNADCFMIPLTGSPMPNEPADIWNLLDTMNPGSFGDYWRFVRRYCAEVACPWTPSGKQWRGLDPAKAVELAKRLDTVSHRVVKEEFVHLLPKFSIEARYIKAKRAKKGFSWDDPESFEQLLAMNSPAKLDAVVEMVVEQKEAGAKCFTIATWLKDTAAHAVERMKALGLEVYLVTGDVKPDERFDILEAWRASTLPRCLVCTIASCGVGTDLTATEVGAVIELPWRAVDLVQFIGRFSRLSSKHASKLFIYVVEDSREEKAAQVFIRRQNEINSVVRPGSDEAGGVRALDRKVSDEDILAELGAL